MLSISPTPAWFARPPALRESLPPGGLCCASCVTVLAPLEKIDPHDRGSPGNKHFLDLCEASELGRDLARAHIVLGRE